MATETGPTTSKTGSLFETDHPIPDRCWFYHLAYLFLCVLVFRVARSIGIVGQLHRLLVLVCSLLTATGRQRRTERRRLARELTNMRAELKTISMTDEFARYSRLERRIKSATRQLSQLAPETWDVSCIRAVSINVGLFLIEGLTLGWLVQHSPPVTVSRATLDSIDAQYPRLSRLPLHLLHYIHPKLATLLWLALCHCAINPVVRWISTHCSTPNEPIDPLASATVFADGPVEPRDGRSRL